MGYHERLVLYSRGCGSNPQQSNISFLKNKALCDELPEINSFPSNLLFNPYAKHP